MKLRGRIALTSVLVTVPVLVLVVWLRARFIEEADSSVALRVLEGYMRHGGRAECERAPATWEAERVRPLPLPLPARRENADERIPFALPHPDLVLTGKFGTFAYDAELRSANPNAPPLGEDVRAALAQDSLVMRHHAGDPPTVDMIVRMPWTDGPCAVVLVRRPDIEKQESVLGKLSFRVWGPLLFVVVLAVVIGVGPAIRRLRQLTGEVRAAAGAGYTLQVPVRGRDEIADLAQAFNDAGREIRERMEAQEHRERTLREFLDNTTHDVMTPLTVLQGHLAALASAELSPELAARVEAAMDDAHYMASLIHNLALAARIEAGEPASVEVPIDLAVLVERVVARHRPIARNHDIALEHATPGTLVVRGDLTLVEQAVGNLVLNAVQHVPNSGHVAVALDVEGARFTLRISDDGPGLTEAELARLAERGRRGNDARTRAPDGRGLGLDIAQRVIHLHGWDLAFTATEPRGLTVTITGLTGS